MVSTATGASRTLAPAGSPRYSRLTVSLQERSTTERVQHGREQYVARGVSTPPLVVERAEGARVWDVEGREYIDFAGGLGCANLGHNLPSVVDAVHAQVDRYMHQCFMVGMYEPYIEVCRRLAELSPCRGADQKSLLLNSGAEAVENAVKIARVATGRPAVIVFDNAFHGRTLLAMTMTSKVVPYKLGFGPFAPEVYRTPRPTRSAASPRTTRSPRSSISSKATSIPAPSRVPSSSQSRAKAASSR